jgi:hypothetical protein
MGIEGKVVRVTPKLAEEMLAKNISNRRVETRRVDGYAADMARGEWDFNGEAIKVAQDGSLIDGQHRLMAVLEADRAVPMFIIYGLDPKVQETVDTGRSRSFADLLRMRGEKNPNVLGAAIKAATCYFDVDVPWGPPHPTHREMLSFLSRNPELRESVARTQSGPRWLGKSNAATMHFLFSVADADDAGEFFRQLISGDGLRVGDPLHTLRERLIKEAAREQGGVNSKVKMAFMVRAWNAWRRGDDLAKLIWRPGGASADRFPDIDGLGATRNDE